MDYLTIITTRSIILFPRSPQPSQKRILSSPSTPQTPTSQLAAPPPIAMPVDSFTSHDNDVAYFLLRHVINASRPSFAYGPDGMCGDLTREAEVVVWQEMARAESFTRGVGEWFSSPRHARISEEELSSLAKGCGVGLQRVKDRDSTAFVHEPSASSMASVSSGEGNLVFT